MPALFWYNCLATIGVSIAAFTIYKKRLRTEFSTWLVFYLFATSLPWLGEFAVLGLFNSYAYKPGLFDNPWADNIAAHLILNSTLWPGTAMLVVGYRLGYGWISLITASFLVVEFQFLKLGIYEQHWWRYYMTAVALVIFLMIAKKWFRTMDKKRYGLPRFITLYLAAFVIIHLPTPLLLLFGKQYYNVNLVEDIYRSSTIFILFYQLAETFVVMYLFFLKRWFWKLSAYVISLGGQLLLANGNILIIQGDWTLLYSLLLYAITLTLSLFMEKHTLLPLKSGSHLE